MLPLRSDRLIIRMMRPADAPTIVAYRNDPAIGQFQDWALPYSEASAMRMLDSQAALDGPKDGQWVQLAVDHGGETVGDIAVELRHGGKVATIGYSFAPEHHGKGFAAEATAAVVDALCDAGVHRFVATLDPDNMASMRVLETVGFTFECLAARAELVRGEWVDDLRYSLLADDWRAWATRARSRPSRVDLTEITAGDVALWGRLATHYSQQRFVATMQQSFRDALFPEFVDGAPVVPWMRGVTADDERAGFVMIARVTEHHPEPYLWRLLVDRWHQRRGIGEQVMAALVAMLGDEGHHTLLTSYVEGLPGSPTPFYRRLGFVPTGEVDHGETVARLTW